MDVQVKPPHTRAEFHCPIQISWANPAKNYASLFPATVEMGFTAFVVLQQETITKPRRKSPKGSDLHFSLCHVHAHMHTRTCITHRGVETEAVTARTGRGRESADERKQRDKKGHIASPQCGGGWNRTESQEGMECRRGILRGKVGRRCQLSGREGQP